MPVLLLCLMYVIGEQTLLGVMNGNRRYMYTWYVRPHFSSPGAPLRKIGGVYSQPLL